MSRTVPIILFYKSGDGTPMFDTPTTPHPGGSTAQEKNKKEAEKEEREKMQFLVSNFTEDQLDRYAMYRRASFPKVLHFFSRFYDKVQWSATISMKKTTFY